MVFQVRSKYVVKSNKIELKKGEVGLGDSRQQAMPAFADFMAGSGPNTALPEPHH